LQQLSGIYKSRAGGKLRRFLDLRLGASATEEEGALRFFLWLSVKQGMGTNVNEERENPPENHEVEKDRTVKPC
jgi:hypothetical protein